MSEAKSQLLTVLSEATSQDYYRMKQAEDMLKQWENAPRFFATLQDIFYDSNIHHDIRVLSGIYLKNGIDRFWRKTAKNPIDPEEKTVIRQRLLGFMDEPNKKLTSQNAVIIARIARIDYPHQWPDLLSSLLKIISNADNSVVHHHALETLYEVLAELSTRLLASGRKQFAEIAPELFQVVAQIYMAYVQKQKEIELQITASCIKCLRILMVSGIKDVHKYDETKTFIAISSGHLEQYMNFRYNLLQMNQVKLIQEVESIIEEYGALYLALQKAHPVSVVLCPAWLDIIRYYWQNIMIGQGILEHHLLQGMLLVKETIKNSTHTSVELDILSVTDEEKALTLEAAKIINEQFVTPEFVTLCAETLIGRYMLLTPDDFAKWEEDPEGWVNAADSENWEFEIRPCAEITFMSLLSKHRDQLAPIMINLVDRVCDVHDRQSLLFKDAVYTAIGLGVNPLYGRFDFESFVAKRLKPEASNKDPQLKVLRRRIAWLLGRWITESVSIECRQTIYQIVLDLMAESEDLVVRLTAVHALKNAVEDWDFETQIILPYLGIAIHLLLSMVNQVEEADTLMKLISYLSAIMDRTGHEVIPYADQIIQLITPLWGPGTEPLLQSSLVVVFTKLTSILGEQSMQIHHILIPMIRYCIDRNNEAHIYLLEDSLDLWWTMLQCTLQSSPEIMSLLPSCLELLDYDTENLRKVLKIIDSYIMLDASSTLIPEHSLTLFSKLADKVGTSREQAAAYIAHTIDLAFQSVPLKFYANSLLQSGLMDNIIQMLLQGEMYGYALMNYMNLLARLSIYDTSFVIQLIEMMADKHQQKEDYVNHVLDTWLDKFDNISQTRARKLACIGFTNLLMTGYPLMINKLPNLMAIWSDVGPEIKEIEGDEVLYSEVDMEGDIYEVEDSPEKNRKNEIFRQDPVYTIDLIQLIRKAVQHPSINALLNQVDQTVLNQIYDLLSP
ncbi:hypothetical protein CU097_009870 [Rhizopus azygosporus]|uniref:Importin N-terminal domain-containing protein n=2 Tax=Rhizopus TaxID=4842 RepID=A0A367K626_RHIAZ|nr:ARM repeat-containing protein [Rhizopus microsporus]RCH97620.1 hypothetical protein CU097_009870 [Rhizopus azygosporus]